MRNLEAIIAETHGNIYPAFSDVRVDYCTHTFWLPELFDSTYQESLDPID